MILFQELVETHLQTLVLLQKAGESLWDQAMLSQLLEPFDRRLVVFDLALTTRKLPQVRKQPIV